MSRDILEQLVKATCKAKPKFKLGHRVRAWGLASYTGKITFGPRQDAFADGTCTYAYKVTFDDDGGQKWVDEASLRRITR